MALTPQEIRRRKMNMLMAMSYSAAAFGRKNLITNGDFSAGTSNWTPRFTVTTPTLSISSEGAMQIAVGEAVASGADQTISTISGQIYTVSGRIWVGTAPNVLIRAAAGAWNGAALAASTVVSSATPTTVTFSFRATGNVTSIFLRVAPTVIGQTGFFDDIVVRIGS